MNTLQKLEMDNPHNNHLNILDLPNEILVIILQKLDMVDVLCSFVDVNQRFHRLALDPLYIRDLDMTNTMTINSLYGHNSSIDTQVLSRICQNIIPCIHHHVHQLTVEQYSMKSILRAANYPQLYSLSLLHFQEEILYQYLTGIIVHATHIHQQNNQSNDLILRDLLTKQITHLNIDIISTTEYRSLTLAKILALILSLCKRLTVLNFSDVLLTRKCWVPVFHVGSPSYMSSSLIKLKINVVTFFDCLYLLDGRLDNLSTLIINVSTIFDPILDLGRTKKLPKLKCFSFTAFYITYNYDDLIVPLLWRMINLEELNLHLSVGRFDTTYIDGIQLYDQFLMDLTQLKKFTFNIKTSVSISIVPFELPSNEDVQRSFIGRGYQQVASHVQTTLETCGGECHIYSLPYAFDYFVNLDNSFQGGIFDKVRYLMMNDSNPFEHEFFQRISQDFPSLEFLYISNRHQQKVKQYLSTPITFPHLTLLDFKYAHDDYAEQFLLAKNAYLPCLLNLYIRYESLAAITNCFIDDATQFNFTILKSLDVCESFVRPENFHQYFPLL